MITKKKIELLHALGDETRLKIVELLRKGSKCACEIPPLIGRTQSNTSMHLAKLRRLGIIKCQKKGKSRIYSVKDKNVGKILEALK